MDGISPSTRKAEAGRNLWVLGHPCLQDKAIWWDSISKKKRKKVYKTKVRIWLPACFIQTFWFLENENYVSENEIPFFNLPFKPFLPFPSVRKLHEKK